MVLVPESQRLRSSAPLALGLRHNLSLVDQLPVFTKNHSKGEHEGNARSSTLKIKFEPVCVRARLYVFLSLRLCHQLRGGV